jgi:hypothetical protein
MEMSMGAEVAGEIPPMWGIPSDARGSKLVEKLNIISSVNGETFSWPLGTPFSDPNIAGGSRSHHAEEAGLTREEMVKLIRAIDFGGQFYSRQNTGFVPFGNDPLGAGADY